MLAAISIFITVFLLVLAITGQFSGTGRKVRERMDRYFNYVSSEEEKPALAEEEFSGPNPIREMLKGFGKLVEKRAWVHWLDLQLEKAELPLKGYEFFFIELAIATGFSLICLVVKPHPVSVMMAALVGAGLPVLWLRKKQQKRLLQFNDQISDALVLISNSLKAGYGFFQAMEMVARESMPPIKSEFARVLKEVNLGMTTEEALSKMVERVPSPDWDLVVTAMLIQRQIGGNLSEILDNITSTIRERIRIKREVKTLTAQGRLSGLIIGMLPVALALFILLINPDYVLKLVNDPRGLFMLGYAAVAEVLAIIAIRKIIRVDV
ncbi:MAG TPA: type II secretion system F family protein [Bacillota bacterium]|nr:type II secretion system F family protein [Bacillota bacterium]